MRPSVDRAALARRAARLLAIFVALATPALAADRANLDVLGYSADGRYFAFEQHGVQDGSGAPYSDVFIVDLPGDKWLPGTPVSVIEGLETDEPPPLSEVRAKALAKAQPKLSALGINVPAETLVLLGDGVPDDDGKTLVFAEPQCCSPGATQDPRYTLTLSSFPAKLNEAYCADMQSVGYALSISDGKTSTQLHRDGAILPGSRGCTLDYRLYAVVAPSSGIGPRVVLISSYPFGFEGPDRRFLAVPIRP